MPLQSSGIIVVEKPKTAVTTQSGSVATIGVGAATTKLATQQTQPQFFQTKPTATTKAASTVGKYFEYYGANDVRKSQQQQQQQQQHQNQLQPHNVAGSNSNSSSRSQTHLPLMRRAVQRSSNNSNNSINKCNNNNITTTTTNTKIKHINVKQQQQQQPQSIQMNQQQHQLIQHNTIHQQQQQQQQNHQQQSQQLATQLHSSQPKQQQQHVQKQQQLSQQMHTQQQKSQQQTQAQPQQQVIQVSEEFIEQATASGATNMMISTTTGEVLNPQIFKIVATDGTTGNMIIDGGSASAVGGGQSKVLLSNLTVLAKPTPTATGTSTTSAVNVGTGGGLPTQQQQHTISVSSGGQTQQAQTINYMSTKNLSYLTTAAAAATPITTGGGKTQKYTVTGTYKAGVKQQSQQLTSTTYIQQPQQQVGQNAAQGTQQTQQLYQKLSVPRHVQMVTRVQTVVQQPTAAGTSMTTNTGQQQTQQQQQQQQHTQMLVQPVVGGQKYLSSSATTKSISVTGGTGGNMVKKSNSLKVTHGNSKVLNSLQIQQSPGVKTTYITQQQQQYQLHQPQYQSGAAGAKVKTSKLLKQYNNVGGSGVNMLQQQSLGTYTISNSGSGHKLQPTTTRVTKMANSKYATHQQQLQHVTTLPQGTHLHHKTLPQQQQHQFTTSNNNNVVTLATSGGNSGNSATVNVANNAGNTIKFVNSAHATVIQQHQTQTLPMQQQPTKVTLRQHPQQQQQLQFVDTSTTTNIAKDNSGSNTLYQQQQQTQAGNNNSNSSAQSLLNDDIMFVNGTPMTDEVSARILQSMAQKSFSNQQRYQQQQQTKVAAMPPPPQQQQQIVLQHASPTSVLLSPKEYPLYSGNQLTAQQQHQNSSTAQQQQQLSTTPTISTQYTNAVHQTPASAVAAGAAYLSTSAAANGNAVYATIPAAGSNMGRQTHSAPGSRAHSLERNKSYEASTTIIRKSAGDYYKSNSNNSGGSGRGHHHGAHVATALSASTSNIPLDTQQQQQHSSSAQIIHLQTLKTSLAGTNATLSSANSSYTIATNNAATASNPNAADDEDIIGEEVRPAPVNTQDLRLRILHAVQQDHTYANAMPTHLSAAESAKGSSGGVNAQAVSSGTHMQMGKTGGTANSTILTGASTQSHLQTALAANSGGGQQWSLGGIGATVAAAGQTGLGNMLPTPPSSGQSSYTLHGQQIPRMQQDDDAHSAISNGSRVATGDIDPGEETETAPEAEAEDDSVTRCICDLTHDDGYMICCDKCSVWQHVDCMGIDRQNIPDEYQCEVCQPRPVDKARARSLQLMKRKEQTQLLLSAQSAHGTGSSGAYLGGASGAGNLSGASYQLQDGQQRHLGGSNSNSFLLGSGSEGNIHGLPNNTTLGTSKKGKVLKKTAKDAASGKKSKKAEKLAALGGKPPRKDSTGTKKTTKRKSKSGDGLSASATAAEKHAANLRQWIENYELAVTNHYSPELRARLHAITKQPSLLQSILNTENRALKEYCNNGLENRGTTVPHAGGKILISNMDIAPSCPIFELRGKYMLSPQYKTQNASVNMNSPPPSNFLAATLKAHKTPGPFIFFYQLPDAEAPMQTMNQDGSYPPLPPQPAYLKGPEICVDTRTYGNEARFVRRSCRPNAEIQHLFEKGTIHLFIVATTRIRASTEITIKHEPHDLLAIENKKATSSNCIVQPTSTACACGLLKDCLFGPPPTQQSLGAGGATKSSSRKSSLSTTTLNGGVQLNSSAAAMQLTMGGLPAGSNKKKGGAAQNINRNRSTSSSGDSSIGATVAPGMNSPSIALPPAQLNMNAANLSNSTYKSNGGLNILSTHALAASTAVPNSNGNMSATSSVSSVMHDSGICTSSSSPSVSIPSPTTLHMHSPTPQTQSQQQQPQQQQPVPTVAGVQRGSSGALFVQHSPQQQQQHQQILGALPTPLLLSPSQQLAQPQQQQQQPVVTNNTSSPLLQEVSSADTATPIALTPACGQTQPHSNLLTQQTQQEQQVHHTELAGPTISDASLAAAAALQSLNTAVTLTSSCAPLAPSAAISTNTNVVVVTPETTTPCGLDTADVEQQPQQQQTQFYVATAMQSAQQQDIVDGGIMQAAAHQQQQPQPQSLTTVDLPPPTQIHTSIGAASPNAGPKSPQKHSNNAANVAYVSANSARSHKIAGAKSSSSRSTSFSEDDHQQQQHNASSGSVNDDTVVTPTSKEKPKLSREDRKMEAILRAIEKMERNQQRKNQQTKSGGGSTSSGATKRRNSNSNSPSTPTKRSIGELSSSSGRVSAANARKKKRKAHKSYSGHSAQARKRRKSRMNSSNESADGAGHSSINVHSEAESTSLLSPAAPLVPTATNYQQALAEHSDNAVTTNEDQAAGLLLAFANPNLKMSPTPQQSPQAVASPTAQQQQPQYASNYALEQLKSPQHRVTTSAGNGASPPATPVSSACLLIEAAVGPLQEHMDGASPSGEFKYPNKTKTKKVLMSNWLLNQVDADNSGSESPPPAAPTPPPVTNSNGADALVSQQTPLTSGAMLGLDSLVQAATMCDYRKQHTEADSASYMPNETHCGAPMSVDEPENLSMAAQKVEEFIQQTERGNSGVYNTATIAGASQGTPRSLLHLPLQVSTCSNNSSVKKRWLRQAISEETTTDESMTPTPNATMAAGLQHASPTTVAAAAQLNAVLNVPNGFTTPLKKRRLIISGDVKEEEDVGGSSAASPAAGVNNPFESPVIGLVKTEQQPAAPSAEQGTTTESMLTMSASCDAAVDVLNVNTSVAPRTYIKNETETSDEEEVDEEEDDAEEERDDVDVVGGVGVNELQTSTTTTTISHFTHKNLKQEVSTKEELLVEESQPLQPAADELKPEAMLIDQDDDVDILRSPSPGHQQMLAAEDNLVKIEPEDTSGGDDVKIDVEREESLAGDKFEEMVLMQVKKEESASEVTERLVITNTHTDEAKINVAEVEKLIKLDLIDENATAADQKLCKQLFNTLEYVKKVEQPKKEEQTAKAKVETQQTLMNAGESAHYSAVAKNNNEEHISNTPTKASPLKLLSIDGSCLISSEEPLKKRPKLETFTLETLTTSTEVPQTSLLKPLSARIHEMPTQCDNKDIVLPTTTATTTTPNALPKPTTTLKVETSANSASSTAAIQPNCMTFLAAAAAAAIERKPPPPPPVTTATTPIAQQSTATISSTLANNNSTQSLTAVAPAVNATDSEAGNVSVNNVTAPLPNSGNVSTALAPRKQNATNNNNSNERKVPLTDDDIQACLHSFHKENILILQSRNNKKSKPNVTTGTTIGGSANELVGKSAKLSENKSSTTTNYTSHYSHHHTHAHNDVVKSVGSSSKHSSASKSFGNSSSGSSSSTKKLHKRDRDRNGKEHSSSSSRSSSAHSGKLSSSSSKKLSSSSHKKDYVSGKNSGSTTPVPSSKQQTHSNSSSYNNTTNNAAGDSKERADERRDRDNNREQRSFDKERHHHRHRTTSSSNSNNTVAQSQAPAVASSTTPTPLPPASKKRQLNFEQELTKDLPLVNAVTSSSSRHRKDSGSRDSRDDMLSSSCSSSSNSSLAARKRRESSSSSGGGSRHRHNSGSSCGGSAEQQKDALAAHKSAVADHNGILAAGGHVTPLPPPTFVREHVAIPHFNNVVVSGPPPPLMAAYFSGMGAVPGSSVDAPIATYVPTPALPSSSGGAPQPPHNHSLLKTLPMQPVLSHLSAAVHMQPTLPTLSSSSTGGNVAVLPPPSATVAPPALHSPGAAAGLLPCNSASANSAGSTYNSIYGKLRDTSPVVVPPTLSAVAAALAGPAVAPSISIGGKTATTVASAGVSANISLSEYLDTKVKSYSTTLGGYVTPAHAYVAAGVSSATPNAPNKAPPNNSTVSTCVTSAENITAVATPLESPVASKLPTPLKLPLTRTASHDPRLNPQLNAPEPPPAPKRKLSINEYRKRMQLSTDSTTPSTPEPPAVVSSTATTPVAHMTPASLNNSFVQAYNSIVNASPEEMARQLSASPTTLTLNKYTLNSPERKRRHSGSEKELQTHQRHSASYEDASGLLNSSTGSSSSCGNASDTSLTNLQHEDDGRKGQFSAAPTLLEKQQEKLCERLKLLRNMKKGVASLSNAASEFASLKKDCDLYVNRTNSISSTDNLDNCLEEISSSSSSSSSTSRASSREPSPERSSVVSSSSNASLCRRATSTTSTNHKWLHEPETTTTTSKMSRGDTPTRDDVLVAAATRCGSESAT